MNVVEMCVESAYLRDQRPRQDHLGLGRDSLSLAGISPHLGIIGQGFIVADLNPIGGPPPELATARGSHAGVAVNVPFEKYRVFTPFFMSPLRFRRDRKLRSLVHSSHSTPG